MLNLFSRLALAASPQLTKFHCWLALIILLTRSSLETVGEFESVIIGSSSASSSLSTGESTLHSVKLRFILLELDIFDPSSRKFSSPSGVIIFVRYSTARGSSKVPSSSSSQSMSMGGGGGLGNDSSRDCTVVEVVVVVFCTFDIVVEWESETARGCCGCESSGSLVIDDVFLREASRGLGTGLGVVGASVATVLRGCGRGGGCGVSVVSSSSFSSTCTHSWLMGGGGGNESASITESASVFKERGS